MSNLGHNNPPEPTPYERAKEAVETICAEARLWLDDKPIDCQETADGVGNVLAEIRKAQDQAKDARLSEKAPLDAQIKEIQDRYNALIGDTKKVTGIAVLAERACKAKLEPWLTKLADKREAEIKAKRIEAERIRREAEEALRASDASNLAEREAAEVLLRDAKKADVAVNNAVRSRAIAGGAFGRAVGMRTTWEVEITDKKALAQYYWRNDPAEFDALLMRLAERDLRSGVRGIPGVVWAERKSVV